MQDWNSVLQCDNIDFTYDLFLNTIKQLIQKCMLVNNYITMGRKDLEYITTLVKSYLDSGISCGMKVAVLRPINLLSKLTNS